MCMDSTVPLSGKGDISEFYQSPLQFLNLNLLLCYESKWQKKKFLCITQEFWNKAKLWVSLRYIID